MAKFLLPNYLFLLIFMGYSFPRGMRPSTLNERLEFYSKEFNFEQAFNWIGNHRGKVRFAVIIGRNTRIYPPEYADDANATIIIDNYKSLEEVKAYILEFLPEGVYYDRNVYSNGEVVGQELAFDLDPENVICPIHGSFEDKARRGQDLSFCEIELQIIKEQTMKLYDYLAERFNMLHIVYSGRGFHIHVMDKEAFKLKPLEREAIAEEIKKMGFAIDPWVTTGESRLIRLPYSLNGLVSRIVTPLDRSEIVNFNPIDDERCIPEFLKHK